jgi:ketosteroid isomerase-like protein
VILDQSGHVELIRGAFRMYADGDFESLIAMADPDLEFDPIFIPGTFRGLPAVREALSEGGDPRARWTHSELEFHAIGERVVVAGRLHTRAVVGTLLDLPVAFVFHLSGGLVTRMESHMTLAQAMESATA